MKPVKAEVERAGSADTYPIQLSVSNQLFKNPKTIVLTDFCIDF